MLDQVKAKVQAEALARWELAGKRGLLAMGTGTGKTKIALDRAWELFKIYGENLRVLLAVPTEKLRDDNWPEEVKKWNYNPLIEKGLMEGVCYVSLPKQPTGHYHLVILDEAHRSTEYNARVFEHITYDELIALSATVPVDQEKRNLLHKIAPTVFTYSIDEGVRDGLVADYELVVIGIPPDDVQATINAGTKVKPFKTTEKKHYAYLTKQIEPKLIELRQLKKDLFILEELATQADPKLKEIAEAKKKVDSLDARVKKKIFERTRFVYNMRSKEEVAKRVLKKILPGKRTLIFAGSIAQAEILSFYTYHSKKDDKDLKAFKAEEINHLAVVNALNEGHNIPNLDQAVIVQTSSNERDLVQRIGRVIRFRPGHKARVYLLVSMGTVDATWAAKALDGIDPSRIIYVTPDQLNY